MKKELFVAALALAAGAAFAQTPAADSTATPRIDKREARQEQRIANGVASGQLTPKETARLEKEQSHIANAEARAKSDGVVTAKERASITHMQNRASHRIHKQKHDAQHA
jgi:hypothetical protein